MSHHLDTPLAAQNGQLYIDDLYVFPGTDGTVLVIDVNSNITGVNASPGFHPEARYEFKVHFDGAANESVMYRVSFADPDGDGQQRLRLHLLTGDDARSDSSIGELVLEGRTGTMAAAPGARLWAGRIHEAFYVDMSLLTLINSALAKGAAPELSQWNPEHAKNSFDGKSVDTIVLEIPHDGSPIPTGAQIGVWCATKLATDSGGWRQINRGGHPMMWPLFWPLDTDFTNPANSRHPSSDFAADGAFIAEHIAAVVTALGTSDDPKGYGQLVAKELLPDVLTYTVGTAANFDAAVRNGRTQADNVAERMFSLVTNSAIPTGLDASATATQRRGEFPYVVPI